MKKSLFVLSARCIVLMLLFGQIPGSIFAQSYCTPSPGGDNNYIVGFETTMGITNIANTSDDESYTDYSATLQVSGISGTSIDFTVTPCGGGCSPSYCKIWVDWNQDGDFTDPEEEVFDHTSGAGVYTFTGSIAIPATAVTGSTRIRVATDWESAVTSGFPAIGPCMSTEWGEVEDYGFVVIAATPCESLTINAGTISLPDSVCSGTPFTVIDTGSTLAGGLTRVWQSRSPSGTGTWTTIAGAAGINYTNTTGITEPADYRCIVTCTASGESDTTNVHTVGISLPMDCYCIPELGADNHFIVNARTMFGVTNFDNASGPSPYTDYSDDHEVSAVQGTSVDFEIQACGDEDPYWCWESYCKIWVDWNQNGDFMDAGEEVYTNTSGAYSFDGTINVPMTAIPGTTRMRVLTNESWDGAPLTPCVTDYWAGEAEDYAFVVIEALPCETLPLVAGIINAPDSICPSVPFLVTNTGITLGAGMERIWQVREWGTTAWTTIAGADDVNYYNTAGITDAVEYRCIVNCTASGGSDTTNIDTVYIKGFLDCYCEPAPAAEENFIVNVETDMGTTNIANATGPDGYMDYSSTEEVSAVQGASVELTVQTCGDEEPYWCWKSYCKAWVDWNQSGIFGDDPSEVVLDVTSGAGAFEFTATINVPTTAVPGTTKMRILSNENWSEASFDPCLVTDWSGEVEDYTFNVLQAPPCEDPSVTFPDTALAFSLPAAVCGTGDIKLKLETAMPVASGITYQWQQSANAAGPWTNISTDLMLSAFDVAGVSSNTYFRCVIKCQGTVMVTSGPLLVESMTPVSPVLSEGEACGPGSVMLTGEGAGTIYWYADSVGGTPLASGDTFMTPDIVSTTTYYAAAGIFVPAEVQIGTGTETSWEGEGAPFGIGASSSAGQFMYTAAQLTAAGAMPGIIDALSMNLTSLPEDTIPGYTVSIKQVPATMTSLVWQTAGFTTVFGGPGYTFNPTATGWQPFPFSNSFYWDGESNIVVQVCYGPVASTSFTGAYQFTSTPDQMLMFSDDMSTSACGSGPAGSWDSEQLPNIIFNFPGCVSERVPVEAHIREVPAIDIPLANGAYCATNHNFAIPTVPAQPETTTYRWNTGATDSFIIVTEGATESQYWVEVTNEWGCVNSDTVKVLINPSPVVDLGPDTSVCEGGLLTLDAGSTGTRYYWNTGDTTSAISVEDAGTYSVLVTNDFECMTADTVHVVMEGIMPAIKNIEVDNIAAYTFSFIPHEPFNVLSYAWDFGDGSPISASENPSHTYTEPGTYLVTLNVINECGSKAYTAYATIFTGTDNPDLEEQGLNVFPNPVSGALNVETLNGNKIASLVIVNMLGQVVAAIEVGNKEKYTLDVSRLTNGMYHLKVNTGKGTIIRKFQVLK